MNIEEFRSGRSGRYSGRSYSSFGRVSSYSRSYRGGSNRDSSYRRITSPPAPINPSKIKQPIFKQPPVINYTQTSTSRTLGGTGGGPFWGWGYYPNYLYPIIEYAPIDTPFVIDLGIKKSNKDKNTIEIKKINPEYKF
jgi:hypothetical protein